MVASPGEEIALSYTRTHNPIEKTTASQTKTDTTNTKQPKATRSAAFDI